MCPDIRAVPNPARVKLEQVAAMVPTKAWETYYGGK